MTAEELAQVWVEVPMRWRNIQPGDVIVGKGGEVWSVQGVSAGGCADRVTLVSGASRYESQPGQIDPDEVATVLLPAALRDAMELSRAELGARLLERRSAA